MIKELLQNKKLLAVILTYNGEKHIQQVINDLKKEPYISDILVVDGESKDQTISIAEELGAWVIVIPSRLGIGGAMEMAFLFAKTNGYDYLVRIDADGQHIPQYIVDLLVPVLKNQADIVIGSRFKNGWKSSYKPSLARFFAIRFFSLFISRLIHQKIYDTTSGMFAVNCKIIDYLSNIENSEYSEVVAYLVLKKAHFKILEVPVPMNERIGSQSSFTVVKSFYYVSLGVLALMLTKMTKNQ
ncbi:MAG: glycosyltransferase family 2 protein [Deltaproteobacteria bacterium]|nr:glycosyltransferase family 2 protein [Deltaproteobacteria bacterium]